MLTLLNGIIAAAGGTIQSIDWIDAPALVEMLCRFLLNIVMVWIVVHFFYYPKSRRRDYYFTFLLFAVSIFMLIYLMDGAKMKIGAALGLFAVFGIIRYRTESVPIREMTYLFFVVAISVINGMSARLSVAELLAANLLFVVVVAVAESQVGYHAAGTPEPAVLYGVFENSWSAAFPGRAPSPIRPSGSTPTWACSPSR